MHFANKTCHNIENLFICNRLITDTVTDNTDMTLVFIPLRKSFMSCCILLIASQLTWHI